MDAETGCEMKVFGVWCLVVSGWLRYVFANRRQPPTANHQPPNTKRQPPTTNHQPLCEPKSELSEQARRDCCSVVCCGCRASNPSGSKPASAGMSEAASWWA